MKICIISFLLATSLFSSVNTNNINIKKENNPNYYDNDYFKSNNNDLNKNGCDNNYKNNDFHHYFDDYDYYNNYSDFQYYDKKDDYYDHNYYKGDKG